MDDIENVTCIKFQKRNKERDYLDIISYSGCWSYVGRRRGRQELSLGLGCLVRGTVIHELMHALGFYHEQSRTDRDQYVEIFWENIEDGREDNFLKYNQDQVDFLGIAYDTSSIMHYGETAFAKDTAEPTILALDPSVRVVHPYDKTHLSPSDIDQINLLYDCKNEGSGWSNWSGYTPCASDCSRQRTRFCMHSSGKCENPKSTVLRGVDTEADTCSHKLCFAPIDGHWGKWGEWGSCSASCDEGVRSRRRVCDDPPPRNGGAECPGDSTSTQFCYLESCTKGPYDCSFENKVRPLCSWTSDKNEAITWTRHKGSTPSPSTGPKSDYEGGYYIYMEASGKKQGDKAVLRSPDISSGTYHLNFDFNMYGRNIGWLLVTLKDTLTTDEKPLISKIGDQLNMWKNAGVTFVCENTCQVILTAIRGSRYQGDIALDEIFLLKIEGEWELVQENVCFGAVPGTFGEIKLSFDIGLSGIRLVYKSGGVTCSHSHQITHFGCKYLPVFNKIGVYITDEHDKKLYPNNGQVAGDRHGFYDLGSYRFNSKEIVLPGDTLEKGTALRLWYGEALDIPRYAWNNKGQTCVDVYAKEQQEQPTADIQTEPTVARIGCYKNTGYVDGSPLFPFNLVSYNRVFFPFPRTPGQASDIVALCAVAAKERRFKFFGVLKYNMCVFGHESKVNYARDGESSGCWPKAEKNMGPQLVGDGYSVMVYKWHSED